MEKATNLQKPNQLVAYSEKTPEWYHKNCDYFIRNSWSGNDSDSKIAQYYEVYNNKFPLSWFSHITNPLNAKKDIHKRFPAKIRPINILRTNIDLLINELAQRPLVYQVTNNGEDAYNEFAEQLQKQIVANLEQHFLQIAAAEAEAAGVEGIEGPQQELELPSQLKERFFGTYKDNQAIRGQRWMERELERIRFASTRMDLMKDYMIAGYTFSFKELRGGKLHYQRVSPLELKYSTGPDVTMLRDGAWAVRRMYMTMADCTERFAGSLSKSSVQKIYAKTGYDGETPYNPQYFYEFMGMQGKGLSSELVPVYHVVWRGKKMVKILSYPDPVVGQMQEMEVDEDYPVNKEAGESARVEFRDEIYQCYRIMDDIYAEEGPLPVQCAGLPYNGRAFSDTHAENLSVLAIGLPFQLMVMIINWTMERLIAKSKGKILLIDVHAIPSHGDWDEEKFFYYGEALGYGLLDRSKRNVDKSWNQYQVLDMSLYEQIKQLIDLQNHFRQMWDDVLGITLPRKGQTYASSSPTNNQSSLFQSNVITDNIYTSFEEFLHTDLNDILEYSKIINSEGTKDMYTSDMFDQQLLELDPVEYCSAALGIVVRTSAKDQRKLDELKLYMQEMLQNGVKPSTIMEIIMTENIAELRTKLKYIESIEAEAEQAMELSKQEAVAAEEERKRQFAVFENELKVSLINAEWDRKDQNSMIEGEYNIVSFTKSEDNDGDGKADGAEIYDRVMDRLSKERQKVMDVDSKLKIQDKELLDREKQRAHEKELAKLDARVKLKNKASGEK